MESTNARGTVLVDVRPPDEFTRSHIAGAINVAWSPRSIVDRIMRLFPAPARLLLVANEQQYRQLEPVLTGQGYTLVDRIEPNPAQWTGQPFASIGNLTLEQAQQPGLVLVDVREADEWAAGHAPGAYHLPLGEVSARGAAVAEELGSDKPLAVICEAGVRSSTAASLLRTFFRGPIYNVPQGMHGWRETGLPLE